MRALDSKSSIHSAVDLHRYRTKAESYGSNDGSNLAGDENSYPAIGVPSEFCRYANSVSNGRDETSSALYRIRVSRA